MVLMSCLMALAEPLGTMKLNLFSILAVLCCFDKSLAFTGSFVQSPLQRIVLHKSACKVRPVLFLAVLLFVSLVSYSTYVFHLSEQMLSAMLNLWKESKAFFDRKRSRWFSYVWLEHIESSIFITQPEVDIVVPTFFPQAERIIASMVAPNELMHFSHSLQLVMSMATWMLCMNAWRSRQFGSWLKGCWIFS